MIEIPIEEKKRHLHFICISKKNMKEFEQFRQQHKQEDFDFVMMKFYLERTGVNNGKVTV